MRSSSTTGDRDQAARLRDAIHRTGYYPEVVADGVDGRRRRRGGGVLLRPPRADLRARRGPPAPDRRGAHPEPADPGAHRRARGRRPAARALHVHLHRGDHARVGAARWSSPGWSPTRPRDPRSPAEAVHDHRLGRGVAGSTSSPPAAATPSATPTTATPACSPATTSRSGSRPPPRAPTPWPGCSPSPSRCRRGPAARDRPRTTSSSPPTAAGPSPTSCPRSPRPSALRPRCPAGRRSTWCCPPAPSYVVFLVDGLGAELLERYAHAAPFLSSLADGQRAGHRRRPVHHRHQPHLARHRPAPGQPRPGRLHLAGARHRPAAQRAELGQARRPGRVAAAPDRLRPAHRGGRGASRRSTSASSRAAG